MAHIFLSYQHQYQEIVLKLRDALKSCGFKTWVDEDDMVGSTLESMAEAVENAAVVIMFMSNSYKASKNCQKEIEYAERENKPIIPIRAEAGIKPSGWLGIASGSKMVIDFSDPKKFAEKFKRLLKELAAKNIKPTEVDIEKYREDDEDGEDEDDDEDGEDEDDDEDGEDEDDDEDGEDEDDDDEDKNSDEDEDDEDGD